MKAEFLTNLIASIPEHVDISLAEAEMICNHCGQSANFLKHSKSFKTHLADIAGFIAVHRDCNEGEPSDVAKIFM